MSWLYLTPEQGAVIESICDVFRTGFKPEDCAGCPMEAACKSDDLPDEEPERTMTFERRLWEAAEAAGV